MTPGATPTPEEPEPAAPPAAAPTAPAVDAPRAHAPAAPVPAAPAAAPVTASGPPCARHPDARAAFVCVRCGDFACLACRQPSELGDLCVPCAARDPSLVEARPGADPLPEGFDPAPGATVLRALKALVLQAPLSALHMLPIPTFAAGAALAIAVGVAPLAELGKFLGAVLCISPFLALLGFVPFRALAAASLLAGDRLVGRTKPRRLSSAVKESAGLYGALLGVHAAVALVTFGIAALARLFVTLDPTGGPMVVMVALAAGMGLHVWLAVAVAAAVHEEAPFAYALRTGVLTLLHEWLTVVALGLPLGCAACALVVLFGLIIQLVKTAGGPEALNLLVAWGLYGVSGHGLLVTGEALYWSGRAHERTRQRTAAAVRAQSTEEARTDGADP